jgi:hypothetical protein
MLLCPIAQTFEAGSSALGGVLALSFIVSGCAASAQDVTRLEPGTVIPVRTNDAIDVDRQDSRVYTGIVDQDVRGTDSRVVVRRGSPVELFVRVVRDNDLILDLESVVANGVRYAVKTDPNRVESRRDDSIVGAIVGAIRGGQARGRAVRIPRNSVVSFRLERPLDVGVPDRGVTRDGRHYHDDDHDRDHERDHDRDHDRDGDEHAR